MHLLGGRCTDLCLIDHKSMHLPPICLVGFLNNDLLLQLVSQLLLSLTNNAIGLIWALFILLSFQECYSHCGLYYKNITIVMNTSRFDRMAIVSDAPSCGITYGHHSDNSRGVIYTPTVLNCAPIFIVQVTGVVRINDASSPSYL